MKDLHIKAITVGIDFKNAIEDNTPNFETTEELQKHIEQNPINNMLVLLKGSRSIGLEKLEKEL